jgi:hypothetical protein
MFSLEKQKIQETAALKDLMRQPLDQHITV